MLRNQNFDSIDTLIAFFADYDFDINEGNSFLFNSEESIFSYKKSYLMTIFMTDENFGILRFPPDFIRNYLSPGELNSLMNIVEQNSLTGKMDSAGYTFLNQIEMKFNRNLSNHIASRLDNTLFSNLPSISQGSLSDNGISVETEPTDKALVPRCVELSKGEEQLLNGFA